MDATEKATITPQAAFRIAPLILALIRPDEPTPKPARNYPANTARKPKAMTRAEALEAARRAEPRRDAA